jgi:hypothetical protein
MHSHFHAKDRFLGLGRRPQQCPLAQHQDPYHAKKKPGLFPVHFSILSSLYLVLVSLEAAISLHIRQKQKKGSGLFRLLPKLIPCFDKLSRTEKINDFNISPFTLSLSKGKWLVWATACI